MVRLRRGSPPSGLLRNGKDWTQRWLAIHSGLKSGDWATQTAKKLLATELRKLAFEKCAFCESPLGVDAYLEIEHYVAKTVGPHLAFDWDNLFPICRLCNNAKSDADHAGTLLKPDADDGEKWFWLHPDTGKLEPHPSVDPAQIPRIDKTIALLDLQRGRLCEKRIETMEKTIRWLERLAIGGLDGHLRQEWDRMIDPKTEYKFVIRHVFEIKSQSKLAAFDRLKFEGP